MKRLLSQRISIISAVLSIPATAVFCWLIMRVLYQRVPEYKEFVTGYTTWTGYFKSGDMTLAYLAMFGIIGFYGIFTVLLRLLSQRVKWLLEDVDRDADYAPRIKKWAARIRDLCFFVIFSQFSLAAIIRIVTVLIPSVRGSVLETWFPFFQLALILGTAYLFLYIWKKEPNSSYILKRALEKSQICLPLVFLSISSFEYIRDGEIINLYVSPKMKAVATFCAFVLIVYNFWRIFKKDKNAEQANIYLSSFLSLAVFASYTLPGGTISGTPLEMYHYGELSGPLYQLLEFGTIPYVDTMPIHGVCDYLQAAVWYIFFDGTYASFEPAMIIGCVVIALITAAIYYYYVEDKLAGLLCILLFSLFGDKYYYVRWAFVLPFIFIVFSEKVRRDFPRLLWCWTFISILSIAWNPSIGGACALAALPIVIYEGLHEGNWKVFLRLKEKEVRKKILPRYIPLLILGICYIPMFVEILRYIVENSEMILETTGDILKEELTTPFVWYATFGFVFSILASFLFLVGKRGKERSLAIHAMLFLVLFNLIIVRYTFVRTQFGERGIMTTSICALFLVLMIFLPYLKKHASVTTAALVIFLSICSIWAKGSNLITMPGKVFERTEISEEYVYATVEETGIEGLGDIYITETQKKELMDLNELVNVLCPEYQFVDMTNQLSHYNILERKVLLPFSSTYNTNNKTMQTKAIEVLKELQPEIIVVSPAWLHDSGSLSTRNYYLYQYLQENYTPCKYETVIFLTNSDEIRAQFAEAYDELSESMHKERLQHLPRLWGNEYLEEQETEDLDLSYTLVDTNAEKLGNDQYTLTADENYFLYTFEEHQRGLEIPFLRICVEDLSGAAEDLSFEGVVYFIDEGETLKTAHRFIYDGGEGEFLIPLTTSPYWGYSDQIETIMLDFIHADLIGKTVSIKMEFETLKME